MDDIDEETTGQKKTRASKTSRTSVESENEMQVENSDPRIKDIESERILLEKENEERYAKLKKLKEEERAATEALKAQGKISCFITEQLSNIFFTGGVDVFNVYTITS